MKILVAPDKFKGTLTSLEAAKAIEQGVKKAFCDAKVIVHPLADGGEGTLEVIVFQVGGKIFRKKVKDPLGKPCWAPFAIIERIPHFDYPSPVAVIEMAKASGLSLLSKKERNPLYTTTFGTGELIKGALDKGVSTILIGIGGSATCDAGIGMGQALEVKFYDNGDELGLGGKELTRLKRIDTSNLDTRALKTKIVAASDVNNPLFGRKGAAYIYAPQKGANPYEVEELDRGLRNFSKVVKKDLGLDVAKVEGAGAAGGLGAGLYAFLNAEIKPGFELIAEITNFEKKLKGADLVITGEGRLDIQSIYGKVPVGVARLAKKHKVPALVVCGSFGQDVKELKDFGICGKISLVEVAKDLKEAKNKAYFYVKKATYLLLRSFLKV